MKEELWERICWIDEYILRTVRERQNWTVAKHVAVKQGKPKEELRKLQLFKLFNEMDILRTLRGVVHS